MKFGIQTFGSRNEWKKDPLGFFKTIRSWGYRYLEPCVSFGKLDLSKVGIWTTEEMERYVPTMREAGLELDSVHAFSQNLEEDLPEMLQTAERHGIKRYVLKCPGEITEEAYRAYGETCKACAKALRSHGIELLFHNGGEEISGKLQGKTAYEYLLDLCEGYVGAQPDIGWLYAGGEDPEAFLWRNENRVRSLHYKDMKAGTPPKEVPVGKGDVDSFACFQFARAHGIPQIMDMDICGMPEIEDAAKLLKSFPGRRERTASILCTLDVDTGELSKLHRFPGVIEAPNWLKDGNTILYNAEGRIYRYFLDRDEVEPMDTGDCVNCNNDHVPSPDNKQFAVSHSAQGGLSSRVYVLPMEGGKAREVTPNCPSFLHGWSPDGKELAYCAFREEGGERKVDVYIIPAEGGEERRITDGVGYSDGPEYSPDGKHIWMNSTRSGLMQVWRMDRNGGELTQLTEDSANNWFPHVSPDGKRVVYLTFREGDLEPHEHLPNMRVSLNLMNYDGSGKRKLLDFFGGQGSINVNSWSPDNRRVALVIYELEHK